MSLLTDEILGKVEFVTPSRLCYISFTNVISGTQFFQSNTLCRLSHLHLGRYDRLFADDIFRWMSVNDKFGILIKISLKFVQKGLTDYYTALAWHRLGDTPLSYPMLLQLNDAFMGRWVINEYLLEAQIRQPIFCRQHFDVPLLEITLVFIDSNYIKLFVNVQFAMC